MSMYLPRSFNAFTKSSFASGEALLGQNNYVLCIFAPRRMCSPYLVGGCGSIVLGAITRKSGTRRNSCSFSVMTP